MQPFDLFFDGINAGVEALFSIPNIALWFAFGLLGWCAAIIVANARRHYLPLAHALDLRLAATAFVDEADDAATAQAAFATAFPQVDAVLSSRGPGAGGLRHAWLQYRDTLFNLDPDPGSPAQPLRATARPEGYFLHLGDETRVLAWWANIFVAIGLTFTFLGIVAALLKAVQAMGANADPANMQAALIGLLHITAAKFWTSIGGVLASIILRVFDRRWHSRSQRRLETLCDRIAAGTKLALPQLILADHLAEARRQTELLSYRAPGAAAGDAAGAGASGPAADRIAEAARLFATVSERLAATLTSLETRVGGVVAQASAGIDETVGRAVRRTAEAADAQAGTLTAASDEVRGLLATLGRVAGEMSGVFAAVRGAAQSIERSVAATHEMLDNARENAARSDETTRGLVAAMDETTRTATAAWQGYSDRFEGIDIALARALEQIRAASAEHAALLTAQVGRIDAALAQSVDRLAGALGTMGDLVAVIDDLRGEMKAPR